METLVLDRETIESSVDIVAVIDAVEDAFAAYARGDALMPPKSYIELPEYNGDFRSMPAYLDAGEWDAAGVKWVNVHPDNPDSHGLPTVMATIIYSDPATAYPLSIMDGTSVTLLRTGAAAGVATDHLAIEDATSLGIIGAGVQANTQLAAVAAVRDIEEVIITDIDERAVADFIDRYEDRFDVRAGSTADAAACDVLSTVTPVRSPVVDMADVGPHTHINAMGADAAGKQELDPSILTSGTLIIDDYDQCVHSGEINVPWAAGLIDDGDIDGELGDIVIGTDVGREQEESVTIFDSTGLAIQDIATARVAFETARESELGDPLDLLGH